MQLKDNTSLDTLMRLIKNGELSSNELSRFLKEGKPEGKGGPTNQIFKFFTLADIKRSLTDTAQVDRFIQELPEMSKGSGRQKFLSLQWKDDGIISDQGTAYFYTGLAVVEIALASLAVGFFLGKKVYKN